MVDFSLTEEQLLLRETLRDLLAKHAPRPGGVGPDPARDAELWAQFVALGLVGLAIPEVHGGSGCGAAEIAVVAEELGRAMVTLPWLAHAATAVDVLRSFGTPDQQNRLLPQMARGALRLSFAHLDGGLACRAEPQADGHRLSGEKIHVLGGAQADLIIVSARTAPGKTGLFLLPATSPGSRITPVTLLDGSPAARLRLDGTFVPAMDVMALVAPTLDAVLDRMHAATAAEAIGAMEALLSATVDYLKQRTQFGRPLAQFQALRHRVAEMAIACAEARASMQLATLALDAEAGFRRRCAHGAQSRIAELSRHVAQEAIQLHGAMGVSDELAIGQLFKRLYVFDIAFGSGAAHLQHYADALQADPSRRAGLMDRATITEEC